MQDRPEELPRSPGRSSRAEGSCIWKTIRPLTTHVLDTPPPALAHSSQRRGFHGDGVCKSATRSGVGRSGGCGVGGDVHDGAIHLLSDRVLHRVLERQLLRFVSPDLEVPFDVVEFVEADRLRAVVFFRVLDHRLLQRYLESNAE